jgi:hypothetical protein
MRWVDQEKEGPDRRAVWWEVSAVSATAANEGGAVLCGKRGMDEGKVWRYARSGEMCA